MPINLKRIYPKEFDDGGRAFHRGETKPNYPSSGHHQDSAWYEGYLEAENKSKATAPLVAGTKDLMALADEVVISCATGNHGLFIRKVEALVSGVRAAAAKEPGVPIPDRLKRRYREGGR